MTRRFQRFLTILLVTGLAAVSTRAAVNVTVSSPGGTAQQSLPDAGGAFDVDLPLSANALNEITITATDSRTNVISKTIKIAQLSLQSIVVSQIRTTPLSVQQIEQLVNDGVIALDNPANFNVSQFAIVLTIGGQQIPIDVPIITPINVEETGNEDIPPLNDPGQGSSNPSVPDVTILEELVTVPGVAGPEPLTIPGILVIEGRIKSLKEFYSVRLLLMNTSGIFTLSDVTALISFPDGGLSATLPADGIADFGDILPGDGETPGQKEREFIVRGDEIGEKHVQIDFGGVVRGPGIPEDSPIPFNGAAVSSVEVKGPPNFLVEVNHPDSVTAFVPYELEIKITNAGQAPALYTTFDLGVGFAGEIVDCTVDPITTNSVCTNTPGPVTRTLGHIFPGQTVSQKFTINPLISGPITSCLGISDQNINLQVNVGTIGCLTGQFPPTRGVPDGIPTVAVVPDNNQLGVSVTAPVAAFFSENMQTSTISDASFQVFTGVDELVPGTLHFQSILGHTVAVWQPQAGVLADNQDFRVRLTQDIKDQDGNPLFNEWSSSFRTTSSIDDVDPPTLSLTILPPVDPNFVLPGQVIPVRAYAADQGSGLAHIELYAKDLNVATGLFEHIDDKTIFSGADLPVTFSVDSAQLVPGHSYLFKGSAIDRRGNVQDATLAAVIAASADAPVIVLPDDPTNNILYGVSVSLAPVALTGGVKTVDYFLDGSTNAFATMFVPPYQTSLSTFQMGLTSHVIRAIATDGLGQTGEDSYTFNLITNASEPVVSFLVPMPGAKYLTNETIAVSGLASDAVGIVSVQFFLDSLAGPVLSTNTQPFSIAATNLAPGPHEIILLATNKLGKANDPDASSSRRAFSVVDAPPGPPPPPPLVTDMTDPDTGETLVQGTSVANARIAIVNTNRGLTITTDASAAGLFAASISAGGGDTLNLTAQDFATSPFTSAVTVATVPVAPLVTNLVIAPASRNFTAAGQFQDFVVTAQLAGGGTSNVTARSTFSSSAPGVASVNGAGRMVANAAGTATLTASFKTSSAPAAITVDIVTLTNFTVSISNPLLVFPGHTAQIIVTGQYDNGSSALLASGVSYGAANPTVAGVSGAGVVSAVGSGVANFTVAVGGLPPKNISVTVDLNLNPPPVTTILSPANGALVERGQFVSVNVNAADPTGGVVRTEFRTAGQLGSTNGVTYGPSASDTRSFDFTVPASATIGGTIQVSAWSVDVGGATSATESITLNVADLTAPAVTILTPTNDQPFNDGFTVTVAVASSDAVGVERVRYQTSGALSLGDTQTNPLPLATTNVFQFIVPAGAPSPDVYLTAFARDAAGNERTSAPTHIILTGADITPPSTLVTGVSAPGSSPTTTVSFTVLNGLADLNHVALYFRRNGVGTFNLYTEQNGGTNTWGRYRPTSGTNGTVVFDSTKMGGDGVYEFYSIGVDQTGNRESAPTNADQSTTFAAGTIWTTVVGAVTLNATNTSLDNRNVIFSNATVLIEGTHSFQNVELAGTSMLTHAAADLTNETSFLLQAWTFTLHSNASVDVSMRGYLGGGVGGNDCTGNTTNNTDGATARSGGSYGGPGAIYSGVPNPVYGNLTQPTDLGSGGSCSGFGNNGGAGGGRIRLETINVVADGALLANGGPGLGNQAGSGSGGSIYIVTFTLSGAGPIHANGGVSEVGGGGGRIALHYVDMSTKSASLFEALGGQGNWAVGGNGTVFLKNLAESGGTLVVDGQGASSPFSGLPIPSGITFDNIIIRNNARAIVDDPIMVNDTLQVLTGSILTHSSANTNGLLIQTRSLLVDATSQIDATGKGYLGGGQTGNPGNPGLTLRGQTGALARAAASYGGLGGEYDGSPNPVYGLPQNPIYLGSGGSASGFGNKGGNGGGRITIVASNTLTVHGAIRADGDPGLGNQAGSGSGGSIKLTTALLQGTGFISANGGVSEVGGGGGRVAVFYNFLGTGSNDLNGLRNLTAFGGKGNWRVGSAGTVFLRQAAQVYGDLYMDEGLAAGLTSTRWSPLVPIGPGRIAGLSSNTLTVDGGVVLLPGGLAGLNLKPDLDQSALFTITDNTATTITVEVSGGTNLTDVATVGDRYAGYYHFDNVYFRRGAMLVLSDPLRVENELRVGENGVLTHSDATLNFEPGLDLSVGTLVVDTNSQINVDGRGYLGGDQNGNGTVGRTTNNALGSTVRSAGSHGGLGGVYVGGVPNPACGDAVLPNVLGSGGSASGFGNTGGDGGGRIHITAATATLNGPVSANGSGGNGNQAGSGSGGSIYLSVGTLTGSAMVSANGGVSEVGGGGGRIAVYAATLGMTQGQFRALGGQGNWVVGGNGTLFFKTPAQPNGDLVIDGTGLTTPVDSTPLPPGLALDSLVFRGRAQVVASAPVVASASLSLLTASVLRHPQGLETGLVVMAPSILIDSNSSIDVSQRGYAGGQQSGNLLTSGLTVGGQTGSTPRAGGSYGGLGGRIEGLANPSYGIPQNPAHLGSGGSASGFGNVGGNGGGRITLVATNALIVEGAIHADGGGGAGNQAGSGSGGGIRIETPLLQGAGTITANGGVSEVGGGGGRIAVYADTITMTQGQIRTIGGQGIWSVGGNGTLYFRSSAQSNGDLVIDGANLTTPSDSTPFPADATYDNVSLIQAARVVATQPIVVSNALLISGGSMLTHPVEQEAGLSIHAKSLLISTGSTIDVSSRGYRGGQRDGNASTSGLTTNSSPGSSPRSGGSYGGLGATFGGTPNPTYGLATNPVFLGSGGSASGFGNPGGNGGGRVDLVIAGTATVHGAILADGGGGTGNQAGSGSGGSILIHAAALEGVGSITARGGVFEVGGGGGRIAIYVQSLGMSTNLFSVAGGNGSWVVGAAGTLFFDAPPPPALLPSLPVITGLRLVPSTLPPAPNDQSATLPVLTWAVQGSASDSVFVVEFSPTLLPWSGTYWEVQGNAAWTGSLPVESPGGFFRIRTP